MRALLFGALTLSLTACQPAPDYDTSLRVMETLSGDDMAGRRAGTESITRARSYLTEELKALGLTTEVQSFALDDDMSGYNLIAGIDADSSDTGPVLYITAHYDHLGVREGEIFNGADDNASGVGALFAIAQHFQKYPPAHDVVFAFLDAEEMGMRGAESFVATQVQPNERAAFNLNLDMVSQNADGIIFASGTRHTPAVRPLLEGLKLPKGTTLKFGHDDPAEPAQDWTSQSDHRAFHEAGLPYIYFGVEDHPHYHKATDTFETIPVDAYKGFLTLITRVADTLDDHLGELAKTPMVAPEG